MLETMNAPSPATAAPTDAEAARIAAINAVLDEVRPNLQRDGGDCVLVKVDGRTIHVRLTGACVMCKLASITLEGIQSKMVERLGEFVRLVPVMGGVKL
ncbi:NifU family protein [Acuticoccus sediminis]|uniref:NifU family protein n=1 Tax=Acuticoccus sediminis TaxID=2184697 RepID=UPI00299F1F18|nr:NifU family protein [Acuticoccus sediminis]